MSVKLGNTSIGSLYLGSTKVGAAYLGNAIVYGDPYNPLGLEYNTMRLKFADGYTPTVGGISNVLVDADENIWDCTGDSRGRPNFPALQYNTYLLECISANMRTSSSGFKTSLQLRFNGCSNLYSISFPCTDQVTRMDGMFKDCTALTSIPATLDTSACTNMSSMFKDCTALTSIPATLDTSACTNMSSMFKGCVNVQSGALALYQQASTQATPPTGHTDTFLNCGSSADPSAPIHSEMAQIPTTWGGTMV